MWKNLYRDSQNSRNKQKKFYCPIENALISEKINDFIKKFSLPRLKCNEIPKLFVYTPSSFIHALLNYSYNTLSFSQENTIEIEPLSKKFKNNKFSWSSKCLFVDKDRLLITGGFSPCTQNCVVLNVSTKSVFDISKLNCARKYHAMTWINGFPAVIGGENETSSIKSVEIFNNNSWEFFPDLNVKRDSHTAIRHWNNSFVFGGYSNGIKTNSIEMWNDGKWTELILRLTCPMSNIGLVCLDNDILIFGGNNNEKEVTCNVYVFDTLKLMIRESKNLNLPFCFPFNTVFIGDQDLMILGENDYDLIQELRIKFDDLDSFF